MGKSIGILMGLRCKQRLEYSSDRYEKSLLKPKDLVAVTSVLPSLQSLIKHIKFWHHIVTKELKFQIDKEGKRSAW